MAGENPDEGKTPQAIWEELEAEDRAAQGLAPLDPAAKPVEVKDAEPEVKGETKPNDKQTSAPEPSPLEKQVAELTHLVKTTAGRVGALQGELQKLGSAAATKVADAPSKTQIAAAASDPEKWKRMREDFPDWAEAIDEFVSTRMSGAQPAISQDEVDRRVSERLAQARAEDAEDTLTLFRPQWKDDLQSKGFADWFASQPEDYRGTRGASTKASLVLATLKDYDAHVEAKAKSAADAAKTKDDKAKRLSSAAMPSGVTPPPTKSVEDMTEKEYWAYLEEQDRRAAQAAA